MGGNAATMLGVDIGSSNMKVVLLDATGQVVATASKELATSYPHARWSEQDPEEWAGALAWCVADVFGRQGCDKKKLSAVSITAGAHSPVLVGRDGRPVRPAILWSDQRSSAECDELNSKHGEAIYEIGFHKVSATWTMPQLLWLKKHEPESWEKADRLMVAKDYLRFRLTGIWDTDVVDAQGTLLFDYGKEQWSKELCSFIGWPMEKLPPVKGSLDVSGPVSAEAAREFGLPQGIPVILGGSDTAVEDYGAGAITAGQAIVKIATAGNVNLMTKNPKRHPILITYHQIIPDLWYYAAGTTSGAQVHKWIRDQFFVDLVQEAKERHNAFAAIDELAAAIRPGSDGLLFHPYLMGERAPYMDPFLRGDYLGMTMRHNRAHFVRAFYEGVSFSLLDCRNVYRPLGLDFSEIRLIGGGAKSSLWRQILCDVMGQDILVPENTEAAFGAALVAGVGAGLFQGPVDAVEKSARIAIRHTPDMKNHERYGKLFELYLDSKQKLTEINHKLYEFEQGA